MTPCPRAHHHNLYFSSLRGSKTVAEFWLFQKSIIGANMATFVLLREGKDIGGVFDGARLISY